MRFLMTATLLVLLASCTGQNQQSETGQARAEPNAPRPVAESPSLQPWHAVLPGDVTLETPAHLRTDRIYETANGAIRRRLTFELLEATPDMAEAAITSSLEDAGYAAGEPAQASNDRYTVRYRKRGSPTITATFYPELASRTANPDSKSMVALLWQVRRAPDPE